MVDTIFQEVLDRSNLMDVAIRCLAISVLNTLQLLLENSQIYFPKEEDLVYLLRVTKCNVDEGTFPLIFQEMTLFGTDVLQVRGRSSNYQNGRSGWRMERSEGDSWSHSKRPHVNEIFRHCSGTSSRTAQASFVCKWQENGLCFWVLLPV